MINIICLNEVHLPIPKQVEAIRNMAHPTKLKELRRFIGLVNYYRDMWVRISELL
jgi:hypothetical protein